MTGVRMDLMKLWQQPKQEISNSSNSPFENKGRIFFLSLKTQLEKDIHFLQLQKDLGKELFFNQLKVTFGQISTDMNSKELKNFKNYLFLHVPGEGCFLIEPNAKFDTFYMYRATKIYQQLGNMTEESGITPMFILKSDVIGEFKILDENYVRVADNNKTLSIEQMSEMLLLLADSVQ